MAKVKIEGDARVAKLAWLLAWFVRTATLAGQVAKLARLLVVRAAMLAGRGKVHWVWIVLVPVDFATHSVGWDVATTSQLQLITISMKLCQGCRVCHMCV